MTDTKRDAIIRRALLDKLVNGPGLYSASEVLIAAGITQEQIDAVDRNILSQVHPAPAPDLPKN